MMFFNLSKEEEQVLKLFIRADKDTDFYDEDFIRELEKIDSDYKITESLNQRGYVYLTVNRGCKGDIETGIQRNINGHLVADEFLGQ